MKIRNTLLDMLSSFRVTARYKKSISRASDSREFPDPINDLARKLHPGFVTLRLDSRVQVGEGCFYLTFSSLDKAIPLVKPGQFLTLTKRIGESVLTRAYTIASDVSKRDPVSILIKQLGGPFTEYLGNVAPIGDTFRAEIGLGQFYYEPLRDSKNLVFIVGGSGITPAISMAYAAKDYHLTILYGFNTEKDAVLKDELDALVSENVSVVYVVRDGAKSFPCEKGFVDEKVIRKYMGEDPTFFLCGPKPMLDALVPTLEKMGVPPRRIRVEPSSAPVDPKQLPVPTSQTYTLTLHIGRSIKQIPARYDETLLTAFERSGIYVHNACRSGQCGFCRVKVLSGPFAYLPNHDGRRAVDAEMNYVHSCSTYPCGDMEILLDIPAHL